MKILIIVVLIFSFPLMASATVDPAVISWEQYHYLGGISGITVAFLLWFAVFKAML